MVAFLPFLLKAFTMAPALIGTAGSIVEAVTGDPVDQNVAEDPEKLVRHVAGLPSDQRAAVVLRLMEEKERLQELDTERFATMNDGNAEKLKVTARPEIARQAMGVITLFSKLVVAIGILTMVQWLAAAAEAVIRPEVPWMIPNFWEYLAAAQPVSELVWGPLLASFYACVQVITKYMGCRERDKAQEYEIKAGRPLQSASATIEAAGGLISKTIRAIKGER